MVSVCVALLFGAAAAADAEPIRLIHRGIAAGSIIGNAPFSPRVTFGPSAFTIDAVADTDDRADLRQFPSSDPYGIELVHASVILTIDAVGSFDVLVPTRTYLVHGEGDARVGFGMAGPIAPPDLFNGPMIEALAGWDMTTSIAISAGGGAQVFQWDAAEFMTDGGRLQFDFVPSAAWDFEAIVVPAPGSSLIALAGVSLAWSRRRR